MSNAAGRLLGTLPSGVSYQVGGLPLCLATAGAMAAASWVMAARLRSVGRDGLTRTRRAGADETFWIATALPASQRRFG